MILRIYNNRDNKYIYKFDRYKEVFIIKRIPSLNMLKKMTY